VQQALRAPFELGGRELFVVASIGIALAGWDAAPEDVMRDADVAMYRAKADGKGRHAVFDGRMHEQVMRRLDMEAELRTAIEDTPNVESVEFISKGEALARAQEKNPKAFEAGAELLGSNPLPASFRVHPEDPDKLSEIVTSLNAAGDSRLAAIVEVRDREEDTN
jgi:hypothetical protein